MDLNLSLVCGRLAAPAEHRVFDGGQALLRMLVTVRTDHPRRRVDVLPVALWDPPPSLSAEQLEPGCRVWVVGSLQRRFSDDPNGRRSRLEIVAAHVTRPESESRLESARTDMLGHPR